MNRLAPALGAFALSALALTALVVVSWIGGALYLSWAGLDPARANPLTLLRYWQAYGSRPGEAARLMISAMAPLGGIAALALLSASAPRRHVHGRGRWGSWFDLLRAGLLSDQGVILGEAFGGFVRDAGDTHVLVVAPTGAGKTTGIVIPNLLSWTGSVVTLDPKREAWAATAGWRAAHGAVYLWAPLDAHGRTCRFNPLDQIATDKDRRVIDLMKLAAALIPEPENETRWIAQSAQRLFRALALWVLATPGVTGTIGEIWRIATTPDDLQAWCHLQAISRADLEPACVADLAAFAGAVDKERAYILNELQNALQPWSAAAVRSATAASDFRLCDLRRRRIAIYLSIDPGDMGGYGKLLRLFVELTADALMRADTIADTKHDVLLLIDEFATFGRLPLIEKMMAAVRGYGVRIMIVCQALSQLDDLYGQPGRNTLLGNTARQLFMPNPDPATSAYVSRRIGDATIVTRSRSRPLGLGAGRVSVSTGLAARSFMKPEEFERMSAGLALLLSPGAPPFHLNIVGWFCNGVFRRRRLPAPETAPIAAQAGVSPFRTGWRGDRTRSALRGRAQGTDQGDLFGGRATRAGPAPTETAAGGGTLSTAPHALGASHPPPPRVQQILDDIDADPQVAHEPSP